MHLTGCRGCGFKHSPLMRCDVAARLREPEEVHVAPLEADRFGEVKPREAGRIKGVDSGGRESKQRWSRDKYNAYMKDYMRKRRNGG